MAPNKKLELIVISLVLFLMAVAPIYGEGEHHKGEGDQPSSMTKMHDQYSHSSPKITFEESMSIFPLNILEDLQHFPSLHPMIVHFPIVLLLLVPLLYLAGILLKKREFMWIAIAMMWGGFLSSMVLGQWLHPHTENLTSAMQATLDNHDYYAELTVLFSGLMSVLASIITLPKLQKRPLEVVVCILAVICAATISLTGHYGAQLTHIHGVGPQGQYLEAEH